MRRTALALVFSAFLGLAGLSGLSLFAACTLDWSVREPTALDSAAADVATSDGPTTSPDDATADGSVEGDASDVADAGDATCANLAAAIASAMPSARACTFGGADCASYLTDPCGCKVYVAKEGGAFSTKLAAAFSAFTAADCAPTCAGTCLPAQPACLFSADASSYLCYP